MLNWCSVWVEHYASSELQLKVHKMDNIFWGLVAKYFLAFSSLAISIQLMPISGKVFCVIIQAYLQIVIHCQLLKRNDPQMYYRLFPRVDMLQKSFNRWRPATLHDHL